MEIGVGIVGGDGGGVVVIYIKCCCVKGRRGEGRRGRDGECGRRRKLGHSDAFLKESKQ